VGFEAHKIRSSESDGALVGAIDARDHVKKRGLSRPVWPNEPYDLALVETEGDIRKDTQAAEIFGDIEQFKKHVI
jgi:hypothetical protein